MTKLSEIKGLINIPDYLNMNSDDYKLLSEIGNRSIELDEEETANFMIRWNMNMDNRPHNIDDLVKALNASLGSLIRIK